jgi:BirA family biotin operon repressor/biotin-[acetyl-CoA-carboxylase] ligase
MNVTYLQFDTLDSTHHFAKQNAASWDAQRVTCITAKEQTAGVGQRGRRWVSPPGVNLYLTLYFCKPEHWPHRRELGLFLSFAAKELLSQLGFAPEIKWPNDLLLSGKKVAGILCDVLALEGHIGIVLSIGLNVNMLEEQLQEVDQPATSLLMESGHPWDIEALIKPLVTLFLCKI